MQYELTTVLPAGATPAKVKAHVSGVEKMVETLGGKVTSKETKGEQKLAYKMRDKANNKKVDTGVYTHYVLDMPTDQIVTVAQKLKLDESISRHLIVKSN